MAVENKRMRQRRGPYADFDPSKALPQEILITTSGDPNTTSGKGIYVCVLAGDVKRIITAEEMDERTVQIVQLVIDQIGDELKKIDSAVSYASTQAKYALEQGQSAETAANTANTVASDLIARRETGEFNGPPGPQGAQGEPGKDGKDGADGVVVTVDGQFSMQIKDGHLFVQYPEGGEPDMYIDDNGHLKWRY